MNLFTTSGRQWRNRLAGIGALALASILALGAPASAGSATSFPADRGTTEPGCDLALWYVVHNPSITKPRGHQDRIQVWTPPTGPCPLAALRVR